MTEHISISASESGVVRVFAAQQELRLSDVQAALGAKTLDAAQVDIITLSDLDELGLAGFLTLGIGLKAEDIAPFGPQLAAIQTTAVVIRSAAFGQEAQDLQVQPPLRFVARFVEPAISTSAPPLVSEAAKGHLVGAAPTKIEKSGFGRVLLSLLMAFGALLLIACALLILAPF